eukprot:423643-Pyramimonas_sp.AAC.1
MSILYHQECAFHGDCCVDIVSCCMAGSREAGSLVRKLRQTAEPGGGNSGNTPRTASLDPSSTPPKPLPLPSQRGGRVGGPAVIPQALEPPNEGLRRGGDARARPPVASTRRGAVEDNHGSGGGATSRPTYGPRP